jgi:hypothetical protein
MKTRTIMAIQLLAPSFSLGAPAGLAFDSTRIENR